MATLKVSQELAVDLLVEAEEEHKKALRVKTDELLNLQNMHIELQEELSQ